MSEPDFFDHQLRDRPLIGIFRGASPERTIELCHLAWAEGVQLIEVPVQSPDAMPSLTAAIAAAADRDRLVGAGTVTTVDQLHEVRSAGARFVVSPGLHDEVVTEARKLGIPCLPGVATSSEIARALAHGLTWLKAFPAAELTPGWVAAQLAPFPQANFVATGGVDPGNARAFLDAGCRAVAVGSAFADPEKIRALNQALARR